MQNEPENPDAARRTSHLARLFFKLGVIGFGGPAAHIAMMEDEVVTRRKWMTRETFLDLVGATNLIPGPNSTEMTMHVGFMRAGWRGLVVAGTCFILPAALSVGLLAWLYVQYGTRPEALPFLTGIQAAVLAVILGALWRLGRSAVKTAFLAALGALVLVALFLGVGPLVALIGGGMVGMFMLATLAQRSESLKQIFWPVLPVALLQTATVPGVSLWKLGLFFLKVGAVLYGSGYVLVAFLENGLVHDYGWLTQQQLLDAIAIGQFTPGPVLTTATFIGYILAGVPGAVVATLGIFAPSFLFVAVLNPIIPKLRQSRWTGAFLDAVNVSAVALMLFVTIQLGRATLVDPITGGIFALAAVAALYFRLNAAYIVLGGALLGGLLL